MPEAKSTSSVLSFGLTIQSAKWSYYQLRQSICKQATIVAVAFPFALSLQQKPFWKKESWTHQIVESPLSIHDEIHQVDAQQLHLMLWLQP